MTSTSTEPRRAVGSGVGRAHGHAVGPDPFPKWWPPKPPMRTLVAATVFEVSAPTTATWEPTVTLVKLGAVTPRSRYVVALVTFTVTSSELHPSTNISTMDLP